MKLRSYSYRLIIIFAVVFFLTTLGKNSGSRSTSTIKDDNYPSVFQLTDDDKDWIEGKLSSMTLYEKCAQMIMAPVYRSYMDTSSVDYDSTVALVRDYKIGGLIMFQGELKEEIEFISKLQTLSDIPLLIASDYERGLGTRIDDALEFPHAMSLGATLNSNYAYEMGKAIAQESRLIGVYQNFAPVADINNNELNPVINVRSFSESKYTVSEFASAFILGSKHGRVIATAKHFPGHGNTETDSHTELPMIKGDRSYLFDNELYPFINAIDAGVQSIMIGHLLIPALDTLPATLSKKIVTNLLQNELGFDGLIVTDAMNMEAINKYYGEEEATVSAVKAGNDIILMPPDPLLALNTIYNAVLSNEITEERINRSVRKILAAKRWLKINRPADVDAEAIIDLLNKLPHKQLAQLIADESVTLLKNDAGVLPFDPAKYKNITCVTVTDGAGNETATVFQDMLIRRLGNVETYLVTRKTKKRGYKKIIASIKNSDLILLPVFLEVSLNNGNEKLRKEQISFIKKIIKQRAPVVIISLKNPYLISQLPTARTYLNAYSYANVSQKAALKALLGEIDIKGKLPVSIPGTKYVIGSGIELNKTLFTKLIYDTSAGYDFSKVNELVNNLIKQQIISDAVVSIGVNRKVVFQKAYGKSETKSISVNSLFNLGSMTEPVALTSAAMLLMDEGLLSLDDKVSEFIPGFNTEDKNEITIKNLLLHNSGLDSNVDSLNINWDKSNLLATISSSALKYKPGSRVEHSILNDIVLQAVIEKVSGMSLDNYLNQKLFSPVGMKYTVYNKSNGQALLNKEFDYGVFISQEEAINAILKSVTGFTGLYSNATDLSLFSQMLLQKGYYNGTQLLSASIVESCTVPQLPDSYASLGWETFISETHISNSLSKTSYGFNSDNGSSIWIDPEKNMFIIFLTNSNEDTMKKYLPAIQERVLNTINAIQ